METYKHLAVNYCILNDNGNPLQTGWDKNTSEVVYCLSYKATKRGLCVRWRLGDSFSVVVDLTVCLSLD